MYTSIISTFEGISVETSPVSLNYFDIDHPETVILLERTLRTSLGMGLVVVHGFNMSEKARIDEMGDQEDKNRFEEYQIELGKLISMHNAENIPVIFAIEADPYYGGNTIEKTTAIKNASIDYFLNAYQKYVVKKGPVYFILTMSDSPTPLTDDPRLNPLLDGGEIDFDLFDYEDMYAKIRQAFTSKLFAAGLTHATIAGTYLGGRRLDREPDEYQPIKTDEERVGMFSQFEHPGCVEKMYRMLSQSNISVEVSQVTYPQRMPALPTRERE